MPATLDPPDRTARIRDALLELIPGVGTPFLVIPTAEDVAATSGTDPSEVAAIMTSREATLQFLMEPIAADAEHHLNSLSVSRNPTMDDQREVLRTGIRVCVRHANQVRLLLLLLDRQASSAANHFADSLLYSSGLRLIGIDHEDDPHLRRRVTLAWELVLVAVISHRHGLETSEETLEAVVDACMGILHPPTG